MTDKPEDKPAEPSAASTGEARPDAEKAKIGVPELVSAYDAYHSKPTAQAAEPTDADRARAKAEAKAKADADDEAEKAERARAKAEARAKEDADEEAEKAERARIKAEAKAKEEAEEAEEAEAKAKAKAKKAAEKQAEREREEKEDKEREEREAKEEKEREEREAAEALKRPPQAPPWYRTLRADPPLQIRLLLGLALITLVFGVWWFVTRGDDVYMAFNGRTKVLELKIQASVDRTISASKLQSPGEVFGSTSLDAMWERSPGKNALMTLERVGIGVLLAAIVGIVLGILAAAHRGVGAFFAPLVIFLRSVPMGALIPLTLMFFGDGETQKTRFIFLAIVPFVFSDTLKAVSIVPDRYIETAQTLGASRWQIIRKVLVPLALPDIFTSLRFQLGLGLGYITLAEAIDPQLGLGAMINISERTGPKEHVLLLLFGIAILAFVIDLLLRTVQRGVFAWRKDL